jgi:uncharacterized paraquat-inducible protein A
MIDLTLTQFSVLVISLAMLVVVGSTWISRWSHANAERRGIRHRVICRICRHVFEDASRERHPQCPQCGAACERGRDRQPI